MSHLNKMSILTAGALAGLLGPTPYSFTDVKRLKEHRNPKFPQPKFNSVKNNSFIRRARHKG